MTPEELRRLRTGQMPQQQQMIGDGMSGMTEAEMQNEMALQQAMMSGGMGVNPMLMSGGQPDIKRVDRWLKYPIISSEDSGKFWLTETELAEELVKANVDQKLYNWAVREYTEIEALAGGDGNEEWVKSRQRKLMFKIRLTRSRPDIREMGMRDAHHLLGQNVTNKSEVKMPTVDTENKGSGGGGFFGIFRRRND